MLMYNYINSALDVDRSGKSFGQYFANLTSKLGIFSASNTDVSNRHSKLEEIKAEEESNRQECLNDWGLG